MRGSKPSLSSKRISMSEFNSLPGLTTGESGAAVRQYRDRLVLQRDHVRARYKKEGQAAALHVRAMFDLSLTLIEAELG